MYFFMEQGWRWEFKIEVPNCSRTPVETYSDDELRMLLKKPDIKTVLLLSIRFGVLLAFCLQQE